MKKVALVTCYPKEGYEFTENRLLLEYANKVPSSPILFESVIWNDALIEWSSFDLVMIRYTWDYHLHANKFASWIKSLQERKIQVYNPPSVILWNMDKSYLRELQSEGIKIPSSIWLKKNQKVSLKETLSATGWEKAVLKPTISASAYHTKLFDCQSLSIEDQLFMDNLLQEGDAILQEFIKEVQEEGEWSIIYIDGKYSHSVLKRTKENEFRVQSEYGGTVSMTTPHRILIETSERVLSLIKEPCLYARVDMVYISRDTTLLMELELIEPELFLKHSISSIELLYKGIISVLFR